MELDDQQLDRLCELLCASFEFDSLKRFVRPLGLTTSDVEDIVPNSASLLVCAEVLASDINRAGRIDSLIRALRRKRPRKPEVQEFASRHLTCGGERVLDTLLPILDKQGDLDEDLIRQSFDDARPASADPPDEFDEPTAVDFACELAIFPPGGTGVLPLQHFVKLLIDRTESAALRVDLDAWLSASASRLAAPGEADAMRSRFVNITAEPVSDQPSVALIRARPSTDAGYILDAWLFMPNRQAERIGETVTCAAADVPANVIEYCCSATYRVGTELVVELMLPRTLITEPVDCWSVEGDLGDCIELCVDYNVVVRPFERWKSLTGNRYLKRLAERWRDIDDQIACHITTELPPPDGKTALWYKDRACNQQTVRLLTAHRSLLCGVLNEAPSPDGKADAYAGMLAAGIPVILWLRSCPGEDKRAQFRDEINETRLRELASRVHQLRRDGLLTEDWHPGRNLTLLWDDPTRQPPQHSLRSPGDD